MNRSLIPFFTVALIGPASAQDLIYQFDGPGLSSIFGETVDAGSDVDNDGFPDMIVGGHRGVSFAGIVRVYSGATGGLLYEKSGPPGQQQGFRASLLGDLDGDNHSEFAATSHVGSMVYSGADGHVLFVLDADDFGPLAPFGDWNADGTIDIFSGNTVYSGVDGAVLRAFEYTGYKSSVSGDLDNDGQNDLIALEGQFITAYSGVHGHVLHRFESSFPFDNLRGLRILGDTNGDEKDDIGVMFLDTSGESWFELRSGADGRLLYGQELESNLNIGAPDEKLDGTDDLDGDGHDDILLATFPVLILSGATGCEIARVTNTFTDGSFSVEFLGDAQGDGLPDILVGDPFANGFHGGAAVYDIHESAIGVGYCLSNVNSTGTPAQLCAEGSASIAANDLNLSAAPVPNQAFLMFYGTGQDDRAFGNGRLCVQGGINRLNPVQFASGNRAARQVDVLGTGIQPGTLNFQCWFRDPMGGGAGHNTSSGYSITFVP